MSRTYSRWNSLPGQFRYPIEVALGHQRWEEIEKRNDIGLETSQEKEREGPCGVPRIRAGSVFACFSVRDGAKWARCFVRRSVSGTTIMPNVLEPPLLFTPCYLW